MQKLLNLHRLNVKNRYLILNYLFKRIVGKYVTGAERTLNEYYFHLIKYDGRLMDEGSNHFTSFYPKFNSKIRVRKRPSSDLDVFAQIYNYNEYGPVADIFRKNFKSVTSLNIIDAGSNIGLTTLFLAQQFPGSRFICIEPDPSNFATLSHNLLINGVMNGEKIQGGVWDKNTNLKIIRDFRDKSDWSIRVEETQEETGLQAFSIGFLADKFAMNIIDILKIDVEGSEKQIFSPASDASFLTRTRCIAIEIHDEFDCRKEITSMLENHGFSLSESGELTIGINRNLRESNAE